MKTQGFLADIKHLVDLATAWLLLVLVGFLFGWSLTWQNGLGQSWATAADALESLLSGTASRQTWTLFWLVASSAVSGVSLICMQLFAKWRRQAQLKTGYLRGSVLED